MPLSPKAAADVQGKPRPVTSAPDATLKDATAAYKAALEQDLLDQYRTYLNGRNESWWRQVHPATATLLKG